MLPYKKFPGHLGDLESVVNRGRGAQQYLFLNAVPIVFIVQSYRKLARGFATPMIQSNCCPEDRQSRCSACERSTLCYGTACSERSGRRTPLVAYVDLSSNRLPMSCFCAWPWRWSEIHLCSWKAIS